MPERKDRNVLGGELEPCGMDPVTGFYRDGCCSTGPEDLGSHTICAVVTAHTAWQFVETSPVFAHELITKLIARARWTTERARGLVHLSVYERVKRLLEELAEPADTHGVRRIGERLTHLAIAGRVGAAREMVSRLLKDLERGGIVGRRKRQVRAAREAPSALVAATRRPSRAQR